MRCTETLAEIVNPIYLSMTEKLTEEEIEELIATNPYCGHP